MRNHKLLDLANDGIPSTYHGNYQGVRCEKDVIKYCTKENDYISNWTEDQLDIMKKAR